MGFLYIAAGTVLAIAVAVLIAQMYVKRDAAPFL